jgi:hypothetical protein
MAKEKKKKPLWEGEIDCKHCEKPNLVKLFKDPLKKPIKGEYQFRTEVEKVMRQATLK